MHTQYSHHIGTLKQLACETVLPNDRRSPVIPKERLQPRFFTRTRCDKGNFDSSMLFYDQARQLFIKFLTTHRVFRRRRRRLKRAESKGLLRCVAGSAYNTWS
jgi:hypothetical protein